MTECSQSSFEFHHHLQRRVTARFDGGSVTSDGGGLLLRETDRRIRLIERFAACFEDRRRADRVEHPVMQLVAQRVYALALGYEDLNDHDQLRRDPLLAVLAGKGDMEGQDRHRARDRGNPLAGKSTLNRLELTGAEIDSQERYKKIRFDSGAADGLLVDLFLEAHAEQPPEIILDLDTTDTPLHGHQEGRFFHGYYDEYCYLPLYIFCGEFLLCVRLREANTDAAAGCLAEVQRIVGQIRQRWPEVVLSPTQVHTYLDCSARWWFKYGLGLPEPKSSWLAFGLAIHSALEMNFRYKLENGEDLPPQTAVLVFRHAWMEQRGEAEFRADEDPQEMGRVGERLVALYVRDVASRVEPAAIELEVQGEIAGVAVCGRVDLLDRQGRLVDVKIASRRPTCVSSDYAFQLATYRQITPGASGEARLDTLVKTQTPQIVEHSYRIGEQDLRATATLFPLVQEGIRSGLYYPNRQSMLCSRRHRPYWRECEQEFSGSVREA